MSKAHNGFEIDRSAIWTFIGVVLLFSTAVAVTLIAPRYVDPSWTTPTNPYQVQVYEIADPHLYISSAGGESRQFVYHVIQDFTLLAFHESELSRILAPPELDKYVTRYGDPQLKLTSHLMLLRSPSPALKERVDTLRAELQKQWEEKHPVLEREHLPKPSFEVLELYIPDATEAFVVAPVDNIVENWVDPGQYIIVDTETKQPYHRDPGVIYVLNPQQYRIRPVPITASQTIWEYNPNGEPVTTLAQLKSHPLGFLSRQELIQTGEHIFAIEGCWYCHTDQTRTLVQDVVLNGSDSYPAPPSSANEYIYQRITFPGTRRIGPDLSRTGVKKPSRDWHKSHFWSPKTASKGSIMPSFKHFFDFDPRGTSLQTVGIPNYRFEAIFQYLMTKGTRITPPTQAWWLGKDPIRTKAIIEGERKLP